MAGALATIYNRKVVQKLHYTTVAFWYATSNVLLCPIWSVIQTRVTYPNYTGGLIGMIIAIGVTFWVMQACITYSLQFIPGSLAAVLFYAAIPMAYILDVAFLGTSVGTLELIGVAIIVLTNMLLGLIDYLCAKNKEEKLI